MTIKNKDPQTVIIGRVKQCRNSQERELGVFSINLGFYELVCLVNLPIDQEETFKVYVKHKIKNPFSDKDAAHTVDRSADKREARHNDDEYEYLPSGIGDS